VPIEQLGFTPPWDRADRTSVKADHRPRRTVSQAPWEPLSRCLDRPTPLSRQR
jgi:hypothetical protein